MLTEDDIQVTTAPNAGPRAAEEDRLPAWPSKITGHFRFPAGKQRYAQANLLTLIKEKMEAIAVENPAIRKALTIGEAFWRGERKQGLASSRN